MSWFADQYAFHIFVSYGSTAVLLGGLIWVSVVANARARRELEEADKERGR